MRKWRKRFTYLLAILIVVAAALVWEGRLVAHIRFAGDAHVPGLNPDFRRLESMLPQSAPSLAEMYEGLPHPKWDKGGFIRELWTTSNQSIKGYRFYKQPAKPSGTVQTTLLDILSRKESFQPYPGPKMCGGYHADFAVRLQSGGESTWLLVCLGCHEVLMYSKGKELICDLERQVARRLDEAWLDHRGASFSILTTRLPLHEATLENWGMVRGEAWNDWRSDVPEGARVRTQRLPMQRADGESQEEMGEWRLTEESYDSAEAAERRVQGFEKSRAKRKVGAPWSEGFALEDKVYWIRIYDERALEEGLGLLERLRRYCEETATHEVRFYE